MTKGEWESTKSGFVLKVFRRDGEEYATFHGSRYHLEYAVEVRHGFGFGEEKSTRNELARLESYAEALRSAGWKAKMQVYGEALGEKFTRRFVEVG